MVIVSTPHSTTRRYEVPARQYAVVAHGGEFAAHGRHAKCVACRRHVHNNVGGTSVLTSVAISAAPANGSASVNGDAVQYQSQSGFTGQDSFTFTLSGSGPGGSGTSSVQVSVTVK